MTTRTITTYALLLAGCVCAWTSNGRTGPQRTALVLLGITCMLLSLCSAVGADQ